MLNQKYYETQVEIISDVHQEQLFKGDKGYIDGYVTAADGRPYAVIVKGEYIGLCPTYNLKAIKP